jgi:transcriptional regulator of acetoin/glycerol metabolism
MLSLFRALTGTVSSYRDGDFSFSLRWPRHDELGELVDAHNELGDVLREQRLGLVQRELLLDTMVQNTPVAMLLVAEGGPVVYANIAARQLLNNGRKLEGHSLASILERAAAPLRDAVERGGDGLFSVGSEDEEEIYHLARRGFLLNGRAHELLLLRHPWPGNVRELKNTIQRAKLLAMNETIAPADLGLAAPADSSVGVAGLASDAEPDRAAIEGALARAGGTIAQAAAELGLSRQALYRRMERLGISRPGS